MVMSRNTAVGSIVVGTIELTFGIITIICGAVAVSKLSGNFAASGGLWALYFAVPGILTISAGACRNTVVMAFALFFNIIGVLVSLGAAGASIALTVIFSNIVRNTCTQSGDTCSCFSYDDSDTTSSHTSSHTSSQTFDMKCSDIDTLHNIMIAMAVVFVILTIVTFTASIYGCMGTCCVPADTIVVVAGGIPVQGCGSTVVVQSSHSAMHGYAAPPPSYAQQYGDGNQLVKNIAI